MGRTSERFAFRATSDQAVASFAVDCASHGRMPWNGDIVCAKCGTLHAFDSAPNTCACGAALMPSADPDRFTARLACPPCARRAHA